MLPELVNVVSWPKAPTSNSDPLSAEIVPLLRPPVVVEKVLGPVIKSVACLFEITRLSTISSAELVTV